jgi:hypothetical protein
LTEFFYTNKLSSLFPVLLPDLGKEFSSGALFAAGDVTDVFGIDDYAVWDGLLHKPALLERLLWLCYFSF